MGGGGKVALIDELANNMEATAGGGEVIVIGGGDGLGVEGTAVILKG